MLSYKTFPITIDGMDYVREKEATYWVALKGYERYN